MDNSRILVIPDLHCPYMHVSSFDFIEKIIKILQPSRVICLGDELDFHAYSFHNSDPDLDSSGIELTKAIGNIAYLKQLIPKMELCESNHGSMAYRKQKYHGTPRHLLKSYNEVLEVGNDWSWHESIVLELPNGRKCKFIHQAGSNILSASQSIGMSIITGHFHSQFEIRKWDNGSGENFGIVSGCLIDNQSMAFAYNKLFPKKPLLGCTFIENSIPTMIPMIVDLNNKWIGTKI
jgi:hypothetical protein